MITGIWKKSNNFITEQFSAGAPPQVVKLISGLHWAELN
jgi:hypothetical protein